MFFPIIKMEWFDRAAIYMIQCTTRIDDKSLFLHDKQCDSYHILAIIFHYLGAVGGVKLVLVSYWSAALGNHPPSRATAHQSNRSIGFYDVCKQEKCLTTSCYTAF